MSTALRPRARYAMRGMICIGAVDLSASRGPRDSDSQSEALRTRQRVYHSTKVDHEPSGASRTESRNACNTSGRSSWASPQPGTMSSAAWWRSSSGSGGGLPEMLHPSTHEPQAEGVGQRERALFIELLDARPIFDQQALSHRIVFHRLVERGAGARDSAMPWSRSASSVVMRSSTDRFRPPSPEQALPDGAIGLGNSSRSTVSFTDVNRFTVAERGRVLVLYVGKGSLNFGEGEILELLRRDGAPAGGSARRSRTWSSSSGWLAPAGSEAECRASRSPSRPWPIRTRLV